MKRVITIILAMAMALSVFSVAYAENGEDNKPSVTYPAQSQFQKKNQPQTTLLQQARITVFFRRTQVPSI
mgnify:CR=1 FL=1